MPEGTLTREAVIVKVLRPRRRLGGVLVWVIGIIVLGGMMASILLPSLCRAREPANRVKCGSNLRQVAQAIMMYANDHGGQYPPSLAVLISVQDISTEVVICPSSNDEKSAAKDAAGVMAEMAAAEAKLPGHNECVSYVYRGKGLTLKTATATTVVAYEPLQNHQGAGTNVMFGDGRVEFVLKEEWAKMAGEVGIGNEKRGGG